MYGYICIHLYTYLCVNEYTYMREVNRCVYSIRTVCMYAYVHRNCFLGICKTYAHVYAYAAYVHADVHAHSRHSWPPCSLEVAAFHSNVSTATCCSKRGSRLYSNPSRKSKDSNASASRCWPQCTSGLFVGVVGKVDVRIVFRLQGMFAMRC